jgi:hypothetical protein
MLQLASRFPSREKARPKTPLVWPLRVAKQAPLVKSHNRTVQSLLALARIIREDENTRLETCVVWPEKVEIGFGVVRFQSRIRPASSAEANSALVIIKFDMGYVCYGKERKSCNRPGK